MKEEIKVFFKIIGALYISLNLKNFLQILFGTLSNYQEVPQPYRLVNLKSRSSFEAKVSLVKLILVYDYTIFTLLFYLWFFLILFLIITLIGNKLLFQIIYALIIYLLIILRFDNFQFNFLFALIVVIVGYLNWWMFKKFIKL